MDGCSGMNDSCPNTLTGVSANLFLTLVNTLMSSRCQINSLENYPPDYSSKLNDQDEFDFIIIGAGSAGCVVANKLSENSNWKILVLEAGDYPSADSEIPALATTLQGGKEDWKYTSEPSDKACLGFKENRCLWPRGKCLGGSSSINAMVYIRGNERDYNQWAAQGNEDWNYSSVLKHFHELEDFQTDEVGQYKQYGRGGYIPLSVYDSMEPLGDVVKQSGQILGYPTLVGEGNLGYFELPQTIHKGVRANAAKVFLGKIKERTNLKVGLNAFVERIIIDGDKKVTGVEISVENKKLNIKVRKEVILSAGTVNSPQILMLSGVGPKSHLENLGISPIQDLPVGQNLQDHLVFVGLAVSIDEAAIKPKNTTDELYRYFMYREGSFAEMGMGNLNGLINTRNDSEYPNIQLIHIPFPRNGHEVISELARTFGYPEEIISFETKINQQFAILEICPLLLNPKSRGYILLKSNNPYDKPLIYPNYLEDPHDVEILLEGIKYAQKQFETEPFKKLKPEILDLQFRGCDSFTFKSDDYWRCALKRLSTSLYHPVGTCKMGTKNDPGAVVDSRLRVHGIANLRVIDASIMPNIVSANTNAAALMIGKKGGDMVAEDWGELFR